MDSQVVANSIDSNRDEHINLAANMSDIEKESNKSINLSSDVEKESNQSLNLAKVVENESNKATDVEEESTHSLNLAKVVENVSNIATVIETESNKTINLAKVDENKSNIATVIENKSSQSQPKIDIKSVNAKSSIMALESDISLDVSGAASTTTKWKDCNDDATTTTVVEDAPTVSLVVCEQPKVDSKAPAPHRRLSLRTLAKMVLLLARGLHRTMVMPVDVVRDADYWRIIAESRGAENNRFLKIIDLQRKRIDTLERDLKSLVKLARETQEMLADIGAEKNLENNID